MKKIEAIFFVAIIGIMFSSYSCDKQPKCGCDGDVRFRLEEQRVTLDYNKDSKYTQFISSYPYSIFTLCDIEGNWDKIIKFKPGETVVITGDAYDDCMKQVNPYSYMNYVIRLEEIKRPPFKK